MSSWQEFDLFNYHKKLEFSKLDKHLANKPLIEKIKILKRILSELLLSSQEASQRTFFMSYEKIIKDIQARIKRLKNIRKLQLPTNKHSRVPMRI